MDNLTRTRQERILALDKQLRTSKYPNCTSFANSWQERFGYERRLDRRTILRDIEYLRDMHHAPIAFDAKRKGYYYTDPAWPLPSFLTISQPEMLNLLLAWRAMTLYRETPLEKNLGGLFEKLSLAIAGELDLGSERLETKFSFLASPARPIDPEIWQIVFDALRTCHVIEMEYRQLNAKDSGRRRIQPLHLANIDGEWYLTAFCLNRNDYRHFAVSRIIEARDTGETFVVPGDFDPIVYYANRFAKFIGPRNSKPMQVTVYFKPEAVPWIQERTWHPEQQVTHEKNGGLRLTLPMPSIYEAKKWILAWGAVVEVIAPAKLRREIMEETNEMYLLYRKR